MKKIDRSPYESYNEKEIYAFRKYVIAKYNGKIFKELYWFLKYRYYQKKNF